MRFTCFNVIIIGFLQLNLLANTGPEEWRKLLSDGQAAVEAGKNQDAIRILERAKTIASEERIGALDYGSIIETLGAAYEAVERLDAAKSLFEEVVNIRRANLPSPHELIALSLTNLSSVYWAMNQPVEAVQYAAQAKTMWEQLGLVNRADYAAALNNLAAGYHGQSRLAESRSLTEAACEVYRHALAASDSHYLICALNLGIEYKDAGEYAKANALLTAALRSAEATRSTPLPVKAGLLNALGDVCLSERKLGDAERYLSEAIAVEHSSNPPRTVQLAVEYNNLSMVLRFTGSLEQAEQDGKKALALIDGMHGQADVHRGTLLENLGLIAEANHQPKQAEAYFKAAITTTRSALGDSNPSMSAAYESLAHFYENEHAYGRAGKLLQQALELNLKTYSHSHPVVARQINTLGTLAYQRGRYREAESFFRQTLQSFQSTFGENNVETASVKSNLANTLWRTKRPDEAVKLFAEAIDVFDGQWGAENPKLIPYLENYAQLLRACSQPAQAEAVETRAVHIRVRQAVIAERGGGQDQPSTANKPVATSSLE